jgi:hypothetical protein
MVNHADRIHRCMTHPGVWEIGRHDGMENKGENKWNKNRKEKKSQTENRNEW